jgi:hypothetical protein
MLSIETCLIFQSALQVEPSGRDQRVTQRQDQALGKQGRLSFNIFLVFFISFKCR